MNFKVLQKMAKNNKMKVILEKYFPAENVCWLFPFYRQQRVINEKGL